MSASDSESDDEIYENVAAVLEARKASLEQDSSDDDYEGPVAVPPRRKTIVVRIGTHYARIYPKLWIQSCL